MRQKKPCNIVIFNPDQMRADALAHLGNQASSTPYLDEFARTQAVSFRHAFCQNPACVPSRCSFFTGLYPHVNGHRTMQYLLHQGDSTLFSELKENGYYVWMNDRNDLLAGQEEGLFARHADEVFCACVTPPLPERTDFRGEAGTSSYYSHYVGRLKTDRERRCYTEDDAAVDAAIERIRNPKDDRPLCLFLGLMYPHPPYAVEEPYFSMIDRKKLPRRAKTGTGKALMEERLREYMGMGNYTEEEWEEMRACYLGMCRKVDDQFGRLCRALQEAGIYDDTAIFFFSDHGDYTGDYGLPEKAQNTFEDCLTNVPFLIKPPKGAGVDCGISDALVELVDFYATALDYACISPGQDHFGKSLREAVADRTKPVRDYVFCEGGRMPYEEQCDEYHAAAGKTGKIPRGSMYWPRQMAQTDDAAHAKGTMIRDLRYKYVHYANGRHEFYDLENDPLEEHNVYGQEAYRAETARLQMEMLDWYQRTCDRVPREYDRRMPPDLQWKKVEPLCDPAWREEIKLMIGNGAGPAMVQAKIAEYKAGGQRNIEAGR